MKKVVPGVAAVCVLLFVANYATVGRVVRSAVNSDPRNSPVGIDAHHRFYIVPTSLVLRLSVNDSAAAVDIWRSFFAAAGSLYSRDKHYNDVRLTDGLVTRYVLAGDDFYEIGREASVDENPIFMLRTLPEKLHLPDGSHAYGPASESLFGVGDDISHATEAALAWAGVSSRQ